MHCLYSRSVSSGHLLVEGREVQRVSVHRSHGAQAAHPVVVVAGDLHSQSLQRGVRTRIDGDLPRAGRCAGRWVVNMEIGRSIVRYEIGRWVVGYGWVVTVGRWVVNMEIGRSIVRYEIGRWVVG